MDCKEYKKAIAYYRVSTQKQGASGLGLEAQKMSVQSYAQKNCLQIAGVFTEVETGTRKRQRVEIFKAIDAAKAAGAVLLIAKLDRLARNVAFTSALMESGVDFVACDMPQANKLTVHIIAAIAEHEADLISQRTKAALQAAKARGVVLGNPGNMTYEAQVKGANVRKQAAIEGYKKTVGYARLLRQNGKTFGAIADRLNEEGHTTRQGKPFQAMTVKRMLDRAVVTG